jgi:hypothetical protein
MHLIAVRSLIELVSRLNPEGAAFAAVKRSAHWRGRGTGRARGSNGGGLMSERNRRGRREQTQYREFRELGRRDYRPDQPWREEQRSRYSDEPYGSERERRFGQGHGYGFGEADRS